VTADFKVNNNYNMIFNYIESNTPGKLDLPGPQAGKLESPGRRPGRRAGPTAGPDRARAVTRTRTAGEDTNGPPPGAGAVPCRDLDVYREHEVP
jgi:hypothetical protein